MLLRPKIGNKNTLLQPKYLKHLLNNWHYLFLDTCELLLLESLKMNDLGYDDLETKIPSMLKGDTFCHIYCIWI